MSPILYAFAVSCTFKNDWMIGSICLYLFYTIKFTMCMRFDVHNLLVRNVCLLKFTSIEKVHFWLCRKL